MLLTPIEEALRHGVSKDFYQMRYLSSIFLLPLLRESLFLNMFNFFVGVKRKSDESSFNNLDCFSGCSSLFGVANKEGGCSLILFASIS